MDYLIDTVWLTINRACNFRCLWCYAENTEYLKQDDMPIDLAKSLVDFVKSLGVKGVLLIGGEPTCYPYLFELLKYLKDNNMKSMLVTNGYKFYDKDYMKKIEESGLSSMGVSIKAANHKQHLQLTKSDSFDKIKQAIKNLSEIKNVRVSYSTVVSNVTMDNMEDFARLIANIDSTKGLNYSTCNPSFDENGKANSEWIANPQAVANAFMEKFDLINEIMGGKVQYSPTLPECLFQHDFVKKLKSTNQLCFGCHLQRRNGLIFNAKGEIIPCNGLPNFPIGQFGRDFKNKEEFEKFWYNKKFEDLYNKFYQYPSYECQKCVDYMECGGGCPLKWFSYSPAACSLRRRVI